MAGEFDQIKGRAKQAAGDLTDDDRLEAEGEADEAGGKVKEALDDAVDNVKDGANKLIDSAKKAIK